MKKILFLMMTMMMLAMLVTGCGGSKKEAEDKKEIKVGLTISNSGNYAFASEQGFKGIEVWANELNNAGGMNYKGKKLPVKLVYYDDRSDKQQITKLYDKLVKEDKVDICIAPFGSTLTTAAAVITEKYKMPLVVWSGSADSIYNQGYKYVISATQNAASDMAEPEVKHMAELGAKKLAIVYIDEPFPAQQAESAKKFANKHGVEVVQFEKFVKENLDYSSLINKAKMAGADAFYVSAYMEEQANFVRQMKERNIMFPYTYLVYSGQTNWRDLTGDDGLYFFGHTVYDPKIAWKVTHGLDVDGFTKAFDKNFPNAKNPADFQTGLAYGAGVMIQAYIENTNSLDAEAIKKEAMDLSNKVVLLTGKYAIDETGKQLGMAWDITQTVKGPDGKVSMEIVYPADVATAQTAYPIPAWSDRK